MPARRLRAAGVLLLPLLACAGARAQEARPAAELKDRDALRGVEAVRVRVETAPAEGLPGVTPALIERGTAERLRAAGLRVVEGDGEPDAPVFFYRVTMFYTNCGYIMTTDMQLRETARLARAPATELTAATWQHVGRVQMQPPDPGRAVSGLLSFLDMFEKDYRAANAR